jgi:hypothetical protein
MGNYNGILLIVWNFIIIFFWFHKRKDKIQLMRKVFDCYKYASNILLLSLSHKIVNNIVCRDHKNYQNKSNFKRHEPSMTKTGLVLN